MEAYRDILIMNLIEGVVITVLFIILVIVMCVLMIGDLKDKSGYERKSKKKKKKHQKWEIVLAGVICAGGLLLGIASAHKVVVVCLDMVNESYVTYQGDFVSHDYLRGGDGITLKDDRETKLASRSSSPSLPSGNYTGKVVYSERSKIVVALEGELN